MGEPRELVPGKDPFHFANPARQSTFDGNCHRHDSNVIGKWNPRGRAKRYSIHLWCKEQLVKRTAITQHAKAV
jgi:hypothetical protein